MNTPPHEDKFKELASNAGRTWANELRDELRLDGRRPVGMWPGTLTEARARAAGLLIRMSKSSGTAGIRESVARVLYDAARDDWLRFREEPEPEPEAISTVS